MAFDVNDRNITELFKNDDTFIVPRYQRNYVWSEANWEQLLKDVEYCAEITPNWSHFIGSMVFEREKTSGGNVQIIDGQQRITTLQLVIFAFIYRFKELLDEENSNEKNHDKIKMCKTTISYLQDFIKNKTLRNNEAVKLENSYEEFAELNEKFICLRTDWPEDKEDDQLKKCDDYLETSPKSVILEAFKYFVQTFKQYDIDDLYKLTEQFLSTRVVTISSKQEEEVYNIFEILNARGVKLKQIELLKNYLFKYLKPKSNLDTHKANWSSMEERLEEVDLDDFFLHVFRCWGNKNKVKREELFEKTKDLLRERQKENKDYLSIFYEFFLKCSEIYCDIYNANGDEIEKIVFEYFKIKGNKQARSLFLSLKIQKNKKILDDETYHKLIVLIRNFYIVFNLDNGKSNKIDNDIENLSRNIYKATDKIKIEYYVYCMINKHEEYYKNTDVFMKGLQNIIYSNKSKRKNVSSKVLIYFFRPLLLKCENPNDDNTYDFDNYNVEHILNDNVEEEITFSLGNLLLCPKKLNDVLKDNDYCKKRNELLKSSIPYIKKFALDHEQFDHNDVIVRSKEIQKELSNLFMIKYDEIKETMKNLDIEIRLRQELSKNFGENSIYEDCVVKKGLNKFKSFVNNNNNLPEEDVKKINIIIESVK